MVPSIICANFVHIMSRRNLWPFGPVLVSQVSNEFSSHSRRVAGKPLNFLVVGSIVCIQIEKGLAQ